ncbi:hypothetical protein DEU56DRAFT_767408 [Suillus clintonianus]|uniref:uncharacterized protein n=1 Tax=Suillus clintonianus TaxID=1904413 RepID=UPI001B862D5B|nr:uncharacterized protein DEU56DRAFT_767408 [Suillus clintonianus]KAG2155445.1 hypothetical protein DEU56DRAFT_767408 [Suillus clintonianus]
MIGSSGLANWQSRSRGYHVQFASTVPRQAFDIRIHVQSFTSLMPQQSADSDDEFPDDIGQLDLSNVPGLQELPIAASIRPLNDPPHTTVPVPLLQSSTSPLPSEYDCDDEIDESTIAALDALEAQFTHGRPRLGASPLTAQPLIATRAAVRALDDRKRGPSSPRTSPASKKGKISAEDRVDTTNNILEGLEAEIVCPICFDIMVAAHLCNPCGHSCCGECAQVWVAQNKMSPTCAMCRAALSTTKALIPNYALDAVIRQYIRVLAASRRPEWQEKGDRLTEWRRRDDKWRSITQAQAAKAKAQEHARRRRYQGSVSYVPLAFEPLGAYTIRDYDEDDEDEDPTYEDDEPVEIFPLQRILRRQPLLPQTF